MKLNSLWADPDDLTLIKENVISPLGVILLQVIRALDTTEDGCTAKNDTLGELIGKSPKTVGRLLKQLELAGLIRRNEKEWVGAVTVKRHIRVVDNPAVYPIHSQAKGIVKYINSSCRGEWKKDDLLGATDERYFETLLASGKANNSQVMKYIKQTMKNDGDQTPDSLLELIKGQFGEV